MRQFVRATCVALVLVPLFAACASEPPVSEWGLDGEAFGTRWTVRIRAPEANEAAVREAIEADLEAVDASMSNWRDDSEITRLNEDDFDPGLLSDPLYLVLRTALDIHAESDGAFDITVGPLLRLYGFGPGGDPAAATPSPAEVEAARARVGSDHLSIDETPSGRTFLAREVPGVTMDLSGIAKGYAVDRVSATLSDRGYSEHLVEIGGEIRASGSWTVGVEDPTGGPVARVHRSFPLENIGMATSGGYRDFRADPADGAEGTTPRYWTHILDPRSGLPVERRTGSVTVLAPSTLEADAWATALFVLGPEEGMALAESRDLAALFLTLDDAGAVAETTSTAFTNRTATTGR